MTNFTRPVLWVLLAALPTSVVSSSLGGISVCVVGVVVVIEMVVVEVAVIAVGL